MVDTSSLSQVWGALRWVESLARVGALDAARVQSVARAWSLYQGWEPLAHAIADALWGLPSPPQP